MLKWYLSPSPNFFSDWLWPYCGIAKSNNTAHRRCLLFCQNLGGQMPTLPTHFHHPCVFELSISWWSTGLKILHWWTLVVYYRPKVAWKKKFCNGQKTFPGFQLGFLSKVDGFFGFYIRFCMWRIRFWPKKIFSASPSQIFLKRQKNGQIVSKQVKNRSKQVRTFFFKACAFRHLFSVPHSICCYFLATPATYFAKIAKKSKFHCIWLIFRKIALHLGKKAQQPQKCPPWIILGCSHTIYRKSWFLKSVPETSPRIQS